MPRGETNETPEVPQEGREESKEVQESKPEAQRTKEVIEEPQAVVEQERDVEESEQIEEELVKAVEAVPLETIPDISTAVSEVSADLDGKGEGRAGATETSTELDGKGEGRVAVTEASADLDGKGERGPVSTEIPVAELIPEAGELTPSETEQVDLDGKGEGRTVVEAAPSAELDGKGERGSAAEAENNPTPLPSPSQEIPAPVWDEEPPRPPQGTMEEQPRSAKEVVGVVEETEIPLAKLIPETEELLIQETGESDVPGTEGRGPSKDEDIPEGEVPATDAGVVSPGAKSETSAQAKSDGSEENASTQEGEGIVSDHLPETEDIIEETPDDEGEEGGSILIGSEGEEIEQIDLTTEASKEVEEYWEPPEMYMHVNPDGTHTIVDASGNPLESPPLYELVVDKNGVEHVQALYLSTSGGTPKFEIPFYSASLNGLKIHFGEGGAINVVDKSGNLIKSPPIITKVVDEKGSVHVYAQYPGTEVGEKIELEIFSKPIDPQQTFVYMGQDGKIQIVDSTGKPIPIPPVVVSSTVDQNGVKNFEVSYLRPDNTSQEVKVTLSIYKQSLEGLFVHVGQDGSYNVVDAAGKPIESPPIMEKYVDGSGVEHIEATYPGFEEGSAKGELNYYNSVIGDVYIHHGADNTITVVDKYGKPIESPPIISKVMGSKGEEIYSASYPDGSSGTTPVNIAAYSAPIQNMYINVRQDGTFSVVDKYGTPVESPPLTKKVTDSSGKVHIYASYPGMTGSEQQVELGFYKPVLSKED